ncbi:hypothetical protein AAE478_008242 [Parahypoxylon ruwenzoriense]
MKQHYYQTPGHVITAGVILSLVDIIAVALRFIARKKGRQELKTDDWLLLPATLLTAGVGSCLVFGVSKEAFGYPEYSTSIENPSQNAIYQMSTPIKLEWSISLLLPVALACTKASFLFFYKRIFATGIQVNRLLMGLVSFVVMWAIAFFLATLLCCKVMVVFIWKPISEMSQCLFFLQVLVAFCATGFLIDLIIISIPIPLIWRLKLSTEQKLASSGAFLLGAVTLAAGLARLIESVGFLGQANDPKNDNIPVNITLYVYWGMVECSVGVFAACLPTLQLFFRRMTWERLASRTRSLFSAQSSGIYHTDSRIRNAIHIDQTSHVIVNEKKSASTMSTS